MSSADALCCEKCGGPASFQAEFCAYCRAAFRWDAIPNIERGAEVLAVDLTRAPLPSAVSFDAKEVYATPAGVMVHLTAADRWRHQGPAKPGRDGCVAVLATALDANGGLGVVARAREEGAAASGYSVEVVPSRRAFRLTRFLSTSAAFYSEALCDWEFAPAIRPVAQPNHVELRCADSVLQVVVNGSRLASVVDARFGFGAFQWQATSYAGPAQVAFHAFTLCRSR